MIYTTEELREIIKPIAEKYSIPAVYLFGSYARGEATDESDVDILVQIHGSIIHGFMIGGLYNDLCEAIGKKVDMVTVDTLEDCYERERFPHFAENLERERVQVL